MKAGTCIISFSIKRPGKGIFQDLKRINRTRPSRNCCFYIINDVQKVDVLWRLENIFSRRERYSSILEIPDKAILIVRVIDLRSVHNSWFGLFWKNKWFRQNSKQFVNHKNSFYKWKKSRKSVRWPRKHFKHGAGTLWRILRKKFAISLVNDRLFVEPHKKLFFKQFFQFVVLRR